MVKRIFLQSKSRISFLFFVILTIFLAWYVYAGFQTSHLLRMHANDGDWISLLQHQTFVLFRVAHSLLDVQYLVKIGLSEVITTALLVVKGLSWIEIGYILSLWLTFGFCLIQHEPSVALHIILRLHYVFIGLTLGYLSYFSFLAFRVFYLVTLPYERALVLAANTMSVTSWISCLLLLFSLIAYGLSFHREGKGKITSKTISFL